MGSIWLAEHRTLGAPVAVKLLDPAYLARPHAADRFRREAVVLAKIRSEHVVQVLDSGCTPAGIPFIVMELLEGETLEDRLARETELSLEATLGIVRQIGRALAVAHEAGVVHRDVKPDNIFLLRHGPTRHSSVTAKLLDFGIARDLTVDDTSETALVGTPHFMAPEQIGCGLVTASADVWGLAVVAYACLAGRLPFEGDDLEELMRAIRRGPIAALSRLDPSIPPGVLCWLQRSLALDSDERYADAQQMLDALERSLTGARQGPGRPRTFRPRLELDFDGDAEAERYEVELALARIRRRRAWLRCLVTLVMAGTAAFAYDTVGRQLAADPSLVLRGAQELLRGRTASGALLYR
jgi:serine/threonine-protein kinase